MNKSYFEFFCPVKILSGRKALVNLPYEIELSASKRVMIITDKGVKGAGLLDKLTAVFKGSNVNIATIFDETPRDSDTDIVNKVAKIFKKENCDSIVALGGGSVIDTAKGVNIVVSENTDDLMKFQGAERIEEDLFPLFVVPTTSGTGSEVTLVAVIKDHKSHTKLALTSNKLYPAAAILDPEMTRSLPPKLTAATGMDALTHAIEAWYGLQKNPVSDAFALQAIQLVNANLLTAVKKPDNVKARMAMANASLLAGIAFSNSMVGVVHAMAHATGGIAGVPHGMANSIYLPFGLEYNLGKRLSEIAGLAPFMGIAEGGTKKERAQKVIAKVKNLKKSLKAACGLPETLEEAGVKESQFDEIAKAALDDGSLTFNPEDLNLDDALNLLKKAYK